MSAIEFFLSIFIILFSLFLVQYLKYRRAYEKTKHLEIAPDFLPIIAHAHLIVKHRHRVYHFLSDLAQKFQEKPYRFGSLLEEPYIFINDPKHVDYILRANFENYVKGDYFNSRMFDLLGHGIFNSDGETWKVQRKTAANIFNVKNFKGFVSKTFAEEMDMMENELNKMAASGTPFDLQDLLSRFTLDGFAKIGFNVKCELRTSLSYINSEKPVPFAQAFDRAQSILEFRFSNPCWRLTELFSYFQIKRDFKTIKSFCKKVVQERKTERDFSGKNDLLSLFMVLKNENGESLFNDQQLADLVLNFIIAGRDTIAQALSWTFYRLSLHPEVKTQLVKEIKATLGPNSDLPTYEQTKDMKYAKAVFLETLRLHPSVPKNVKRSVHDDTLPDGTFIPAGFNVAWSPYAQARSKFIWGPDAAEFKPSRWLEMTTQPNPSQYSVFHAGPRICLGKTMAEIEGVYVLTSILNKFDIHVVDPESVHYGMSLTLTMANGLMVNVSKRK